MALTGLEHYLVLTANLDATRDFYRDALGMSQGFRPPLGFRATGCISAQRP